LKIAYFDCFSGISGDMCLGSLVDAGVSLKKLEKELKKIPVTGYRLSLKKVDRAHIAACNVDVIQKSEAKNRDAHLTKWKEIKEIMHRSSLSEDIQQKGLKIFRRLFEAEAAVHGKTFHTVHLHELGALDCIIDILGTVIGLDILGVEKVYSSPINLGSGSVKTVSGILPVPAPATSEILKKVPVYSKIISTELTTPTGAAIIKELSSGFGDIPCMDIERIGIGAGDRDFTEWPNVLRVFIGSSFSLPSHKEQTGLDLRVPEVLPHESVHVIETNIDDMNPQIFEYVIEKLFKAGALDAYLTQIIMKKGRPALKLTVLCREDRKEDLIKIIFEETSTIGLRFYETKRKTLRREIKTIDTEFGKVRVKYSRYNRDGLKATPEYEDCKKIAKRLKIPLMEVMKKIK
jgi:pyridinium-3,5-bisthiocarboxylic acid mononucleotide nickel chelatase